MHQLVQHQSTLYAAHVHLGRQNMSFCWYINLFTVQTSENICLDVFKRSVHCNFMYGLVSNPRKLENIWGLEQSNPPTGTDMCCLAYTNVFFWSVGVGSSAAQSMSTVVHLWRMENDANLYYLINPICSCFSNCKISLYLSFFVLASGWTDFAVKTSE